MHTNTERVAHLRFFASYGRTEAGWAYYFGDFAAQTLPLRDSVHLSLQIQNGSDVAFAEVTVRYTRFSNTLLTPLLTAIRTAPVPLAPVHGCGAMDERVNILGK